MGSTFRFGKHVTLRVLRFWGRSARHEQKQARKARHFSRAAVWSERPHGRLSWTVRGSRRKPERMRSVRTKADFEKQRQRLMRGRSLQTARHEAAHAVVAEAFGIRVVRVELQTGNPKELGAIHLDGRFNVGRLIDGIITAAGCCAEHRWHRVHRRWFSDGDAKMLTKLFPNLNDLHLVIASARACVARNADTIDRVAKALVKRDLSGPELRRLIARR